MYRELANQVADLHNLYGGSLVGMDGEDLLDGLSGELRVPEEAPVFEIESCQLTRKTIRRAFWNLRHRREWGLSRGVIWSATEGGTSFVGLGEVVPPGTPLPALTKMTIPGESDG
jgi:hypothetical protein